MSAALFKVSCFCQCQCVSVLAASVVDVSWHNCVAEISNVYKYSCGNHTW